MAMDSNKFSQPNTLEEQFSEAITVLIHAGSEPQGQPYIHLDDESITICGGKSERPDRGINVSREFGTQITGPMSFAEMPQNMSFGCGYWRLNPLILTCIGSSAALPIPTLVYSTPNILKAAKDMASLGSGIGV